jgi:hypothetical protein
MPPSPEVARPPTLGERLAADGHRLIGSRQPAAPWRAALRPLLDRVAQLPTPAASHYRRTEAPLNARDLVPPPPDEPATMADPGGEPLPGAVENQLHGLVGAAAGAMRVHHDAEADAVARVHSADAVTFGRDVFFRAGRYRPDERAGLALLAHEATHVRESTRSASTWRRATARGIADEEREAGQVERAVAASERRVASAPAAPLVVPAAAHPQHVERAAVVPERWPAGARATAVMGTASPPPQPAASPGPAMTAAVGRELDAKAGVAGPAVDFEELRRALYRDMLGQLRSELERGA